MLRFKNRKAKIMQNFLLKARKTLDMLKIIHCLIDLTGLNTSQIFIYPWQQI